MRSAEITRGGGKAFVHILTDAEPAGATLRASSTLPSGAAGPCLCYKLEGVAGWVLCLPVLDVTQRMLLVLEAEGGVALDRAELSLGPRYLRSASQMGTLTKAPLVDVLRNSDLRVRDGRMSVTILEHVCDYLHGRDRIHGVARLETTSRAEAAAPVEVHVMDASGRERTLERWRDMGDTLVECADAPGTWRRTLAFSALIPSGVPSYVLWAWTAEPDPRAVGPDGASTGEQAFLVMQPHVLADARNRSIGSMLPFELQPGYELWFLTRHRASSDELARQRRHPFAQRPLFSFVVPLYHTPVAYLREMAASALAQSYENLELVLVNSTPEDVGLSEAVSGLAAADGRVRVVELEENQGIVGNTNAGVAVAKGDFVCFLDHDDTIEPDLLYHYARAVEERPDTDMIYCDEDKLEGGHYGRPLLKCDWSPDLLTSNNYVTHLLCIRRTVLDEMCPLERRFEGAQDYHMALYAGELARHVAHVPRILYHWRVHPGPVSAGPAAKTYTVSAARAAIEAHLARVGLAGEVVPDPAHDGFFHVDYALAEEPLVSVIIPNKDMAPVLRRCVDSVLGRTDYPNVEVVVAENNSVEQETFRLYGELERDARVRVVREEGDGTFNFSRTCNFGAAQARGDYLLFLNNDVEVLNPRWLRTMMGLGMQRRVGVVGAKLLFPDGLIQHAGIAVHKESAFHLGTFLPATTDANARRFCSTCDVSAVTGACMLVRRDVYERLGGMDEGLAENYNDVDLCLKARREGLWVVFEPMALLRHYESLSRGAGVSDARRVRAARERGILMARWPEYFAEGDPFMHPVLAADPHMRGDLDVALEDFMRDVPRMA